MSGYSLPIYQNFQSQKKFYQPNNYGPTPDSFTSLDKKIINSNFNNRSNANYLNDQNYYPNIEKFFTYNGVERNQYEKNPQIIKNEFESSRQQNSYKQLQLISNNKIQLNNQSSTAISHKKLPRTQKKLQNKLKSSTKNLEQNKSKENQNYVAQQIQNNKKSNDSLSLQNIEIKSSTQENDIETKKQNRQQQNNNNESYKNISTKAQNFITFKDIRTLRQEQQDKLKGRSNPTQTFKQNQIKEFLAYQQRNKGSLYQKLETYYNNQQQSNKNHQRIIERESDIPLPPQSISRFQIIPIQTRFTQIYHQVIEIPVQKVGHRYYTIEHKTQYIPKVTQIIQQYLVPQERNIYHLQYVPVQKRIVHLPIDEEKNFNIEKNYQLKLNDGNFQNQNNRSNYDYNTKQLIYPIQNNSNVNRFQRFNQGQFLGQRQSFIDTFVNQKPLPQLQLISQFQKPSQRQINSNKFIPQSSFQRRITSPQAKTLRNNQFRQFINVNNSLNNIANSFQSNNRLPNSTLNQAYLPINNKIVENGINSPRFSQKFLQKKTNFVTVQGAQYFKRVQQRKKLERQLFNFPSD